MYDCTLIDICLPSYLQDHHNRDGETLLGVPVDGSTRNGAVRDMVQNELQSCDWGFPDSFDWDAAKRAINDCFKPCDGRRLFDSSLDRNSADCDESCYAYFLLTYPP